MISLMRLGFRWILPAAQCIFCIVLLVLRSRENAQLPQTESIFDPTTRAGEIVFQTLNLPVLLILESPRVWMQDQQRWSESLATWQGALLVLFFLAVFWFGVGRWLDRQCGLLPRSTWRGSKMYLMLSAIGIMSIGSLGIRFLFQSADIWWRLSGFLWAAFACWMLAQHIRRTWPGLRGEFIK